MSGEAPRPLRPLDLLAALADHDAEFVVIGGFALAAHGVVRGTKDVDVVPEPSRENLGRLAAALAVLEATVELGDLDQNELGVALDAESLAQGGNWALQTTLGRLDVMQDVPGLRSYRHLRSGAVSPAIPGLPREVLFAGLDDLIALKRAAGRDQDLLDIADLERARGSLG